MADIRARIGRALFAKPRSTMRCSRAVSTSPCTPFKRPADAAAGQNHWAAVGGARVRVTRSSGGGHSSGTICRGVA